MLRELALFKGPKGKPLMVLEREVETLVPGEAASREVLIIVWFALIGEAF